jgi:TolB-like protein/tetratricopeptide (TPR) repeat protein
VVLARRGVQVRADSGGPAAASTLAVLPFENVGDSADTYLADGFSDAVRGKLAALPGVQVIAGASSSDYRHTAKPPQQIARELGVRYLLVGTVRKESGSGHDGRLRVSPELLEVRPRGVPTTKWQEPIQASLSDIFQVQGDVARGVAEALGVTLGDEDRLELTESPTRSLAAYHAYLRGEQISKGSYADAGTLRRALPYYEQAIALDSAFVQAWMQLARVRVMIFGAGGTHTPAEMDAARVAAERALALAPNGPEGRLALGDYYLIRTDNSEALKQYTLGLQVAPNHEELLASAGLAEQYLGRWDMALEHFRRAYALDPRSVNAARTLAWAMMLLRRHEEALSVADRAVALQPDVADLIELKVMILLAKGDLAGARSAVRSGLKAVEPTTLVATFAYNWDLYWVFEEPEQQLLRRLRPSAFDDNRASWGLVLAQMHGQAGDWVRARTFADSARLAFEEQLKVTPDDPQLHVLYGLTLAYLGRKAEAVHEGERGSALAPLKTQTLLGPYLRHQLVRIYLLVDEPERALDRLEPLLKVPYYLSEGWLKVDPTFTPLHGNPRFERLTKGTI